MELLRFTTAGSVDDGKSTLIGRLLYDSKTVYEDQLASVRKATTNRTTKGLDLSLLTDGLRAEREQGITIDVAYRYFSTPRRKFIIADTPGHEQYTRNMATGASTANLAIILIDARYGVLPQSRRHAYIASLLGIPHIVVAINKMDLVDFRHDVFAKIREDFRNFAGQLRLPDVEFIPISALDGDNVVKPSARMDWYTGPSLLEHLEEVPLAADHNLDDLRFPVQYVIRPDQDFRGFAGQVSSGIIRRGDTVQVLPSGKTSRVKSLVTFDGDLEEAFAPMAVTVKLDDEIDVSRGDMLVHPENLPQVTRRFQANLVWMNEKPLEPHRPFLLKQTKQTVQARVRRIVHRTDINSLGKMAASQLNLNEIGLVEVECNRPIYCDPYMRNRQTGSFILIDPITNDTVAAGMISGSIDQAPAGPVTTQERTARIGHQPKLVLLPNAGQETAAAVERQLFDRGYLVYTTARLESAKAAVEAGLVALVFGTDANRQNPPDIAYLVLDHSTPTEIVAEFTTNL